MGVLDRYGGPEAWEAECREREAARAEAEAGATCLDCIGCVPCGRAGFEGCGWCRDEGGFVFADDGAVAEQGLECFEGR